MSSDGAFRPISKAPGSTGRLHRCQSESVGVMQTADESRLVATRRISAGERLFRIEGETTQRPSRYSLQIDEDLHLDIGNGRSAEEILGRYYWRFINHSCDPSVAIEGREVVALRAIDPGEAVTYNYNTTEWDIAEPFACRCGSANCLQEIRGFKHLGVAQRERLRGVAPHLARKTRREDAGTVRDPG